MMFRMLKAVLATSVVAGLAVSQTVDDELLPNGEYPLAPYTQSNENAGANPMISSAVLVRFMGRKGFSAL